LFDAASISSTSIEFSALSATQVGHTPHGSPCDGFSQLIARASTFAAVVFPVPRVPENRYACATRPVSTCRRSVFTTASWPTISENVLGRHWRYSA